MFVTACTALTPLVTHAEAHLTNGSGAQGDIYRAQDEAPLPIPEVDATTTDDSAGDAYAPRSESVRGMLIAQSHRSTVASVVRSLIGIADRETNQRDLATRIRGIAKTLKAGEATTTTAIQRVSSRGAVKSFFAGSDRANLHILKEEIAKMQDTLIQLKSVSATATNDVDSALFIAHIQALEEDLQHTQDFVAAYEDAVGFFGWFGGFTAS